MCRMWATHWRKPSLWLFRFLHLHLMAKNKKAKQELISDSDYFLIFWSSWKHLLQFGMITGHFWVSKTLTFKPVLWKWVWFAWKWKIISISKAEHLTWFWYRGPGEPGNGFFNLTWETVLAKMLSESYFCQTRSLNVVGAPNLILFSFFNLFFFFSYDNVFAIRCIRWRNKYSVFIVATEGGKNQPHIPSAKRKNGTFTRSRLVDLRKLGVVSVMLISRLKMMLHERIRSDDF